MKLIIKVGVPLNFDAGDGTNTFEGVVDDATFGSREVKRDSRPASLVPELKGKKGFEISTEYWFAVDCKELNEEGAKFSSLLITSRYKVQEHPFEMMKRGESLVMHAAWRNDCKRWDKESIAAAINGEAEMGGMFVVNVSFLPEDVVDTQKHKMRKEDLM